MLKCSRFRDNGGIMRHTGLIHPKFDLKLVLKMGDLERGVLSRFTLRFTRKMAVLAQISQKRKTL